MSANSFSASWCTHVDLLNVEEETFEGTTAMIGHKVYPPLGLVAASSQTLDQRPIRKGTQMCGMNKHHWPMKSVKAASLLGKASLVQVVIIFLDSA